MNLCLACRDIGPDERGGLARATCDLAEALAQQGHAVNLLTNRTAAPVPELRGVSIKRLPVPPASGPLAGAAPESAPHNLMHAAAVYREVWRIHEDEQPVDAVLAPLWRSEGVICLLDDRFPTIVSCMTSLRTLTEVDGSYQLQPDIAQRLSLEREALARSRYLHGLTEAVLSKTIRDYHLRPDASAVIGRGLRDRATLEVREAGRDEKLQILFVGRLERRKGVDTLLAAARELGADGLPVRFTLAGANSDPTFRDSFEREAAERPWLREVVHFAGAVSDAELDRLYAAADIVCVPSRYESHGVVLLEAMMFGKPIVTCDAGGIGEIVEAGRTALLSAPEDVASLAESLRRLAGDVDLRKRLAAAAREAYERRFDARSVAGRLQLFMKEVIAIHRGAAAASNEVPGRLERLIRDTLAIAPEEASTVAAELLDPAARTLPRLRAVALASPVPRLLGAGTPRVTAVVLTRNRPRLLRRALDSLELSETPVQTIVVDNASAPVAAHRVADDCAGRAHTELRRLDRNLGCAGGRRVGAELADSELVLFLDDDAELLPGALDHLLAELDAHPRAGAVTATVILPDGVVHHSGGSLESNDEIATFGLIGGGLPFDPAGLPRSGTAGWVPGTAALVRRELLEEFPIDDEMAAYYEDNEWCYRISLARPGSFRRSREALVLHRLVPKLLEGGGLEDRRVIVEHLAACARFYRRHGLLLGSLFDEADELRGEDGVRDLAGARVLMELIGAKGTDWTLKAWADGDLTGLLNAHRRQAGQRQAENGLAQALTEIERSQAKIERLQEAVLFLDHQLLALVAPCAELEQRVKSLDAQLSDILSSHSWRVTAPLRRAGDRVRGKLRRQS